MPKHGPIVPAAAASHQPSKKKKKRTKSEEPAEPPQKSNEAEQLSILRDIGARSREGEGVTLSLSSDRSDKASRFLSWLLAPLTPADFLREYYGRRPLLIQRHNACASYLDGWFSMAELDRMVRSGSLEWTADIDAASYVNGKRETLNGEGVAKPADAWRRYREGCSLRLSWPQKHSEPIWRFISLLEEFFGCGGGANVYATPPGNKQGFAPHWDDIDAWILQLDGAKRWRVYAPLSINETLPRYSSHNLDESELGTMIGEVTLRAGDVLYLPRGFVHQAVTIDDGDEDEAVSGDGNGSGGLPACGSLHLTVSTGRQHTWRDLLEFGLTGALDALTSANTEWRETLPANLHDVAGVVHSNDGGLEEVAEDGDGDEDEDEDDEDDEASAERLLAKRRAAVGKRLRGMLHALADSLPLDAACDQFVCNRFLYDRMPPWLAPADRSRIPSDPDEAVQLTSRVRLVTKRCARLAIEEDIAALYHCCTNSMTYHGEPEPQRIDFAMEAAPALEKLIVGYPKYLTVGKLPADDDEQRLDIVRALAEAGVVMVAKEKSEGGGSAGAGSSSDSKRGNGSMNGGKKKRPRLS